MNINYFIVKTVILLIISNCFMTFAWYGHLKNLHNKPWIIAV
ncbi:MAG: DMT family protein, partial [Lentisphaeria bacterium]|nr:DMT family protein [Lentisphaeria bacterium]